MWGPCHCLLGVVLHYFLHRFTVALASTYDTLIVISHYSNDLKPRHGPLCVRKIILPGGVHAPLLFQHFWKPAADALQDPNISL